MRYGRIVGGVERPQPWELVEPEASATPPELTASASARELRAEARASASAPDPLDPAPPSDNGPDWYTTPFAAAYCGLPVTTFKDHVRRKHLVGVKPSPRRLLFARRALDTFAAQYAAHTWPVGHPPKYPRP